MFSYVFLDATDVEERMDLQVVSRAAIIAWGVTAEGGREVLDVEDSEDAVSWTGVSIGPQAAGLLAWNS
jgi:putative transposase